MSAPFVIAGSADPEPVADRVSLSPESALIVMDDGNGYVLDLDGKFHAISKIGSTMLRTAVEDGRGVAVSRVAETYDVDPMRVDADLTAFLGDMEAKGIIRTRQDGTARRTSMPRRLGAGAVAALARISLRVLPSARFQAGAALSLAKLSFAVFGWSATVDAWSKRFARRVAATSEAGDAAERIDRTVREASVRNLFGSNCKERALVCTAMARDAGLPAQLVIGVEFYPLEGHCWCEIAGTIISDDPATCRRFVPVFRYS